MKTAQKTGEYRIDANLPGAPTLREAVSLLGRLVEGPSFLDAWIPQILDEARQAEEWYVARRIDAPDRSLSMQIFVWPPGTGTRIHDHAAWGALRPVVGSVLEKRYERLDDGSVHEHARLKQSWELTWTKEDGASTVLPYDGGIHSISNPGDRTAVTVHLYGPARRLTAATTTPPATTSATATKKNRSPASRGPAGERGEMRGEQRTIRPVSVRDLSAGDGPGLRAMLGRLGGDTIYKRFHTPYPRVPESMLAHLMGQGGARSLVAVADDEIVGHALYAGSPGGEAEVAVVVEDGWRSHGIGKLLLSGLARRAAGRGVEAFTAVALGENRRVLGLADAVFAGAHHTLKGGTYEMSMPLRGLRPTAKPGPEIQPAA